MKKSNRYFARLVVAVMALVALSVFSLSAYAAVEDAQAEPEAASVETVSSSSSSSSSSSTKETKNVGKTIAISLGISLVATGVTVFFIAHSYKTNGQSEPYTYKKQAPLTLSQSQDIHIDTRITRRKIERNDN